MQALTNGPMETNNELRNTPTQEVKSLIYERESCADQSCGWWGERVFSINKNPFRKKINNWALPNPHTKKLERKIH